MLKWLISWQFSRISELEKSNITKSKQQLIKGKQAFSRKMLSVQERQCARGSRRFSSAAHRLLDLLTLCHNPQRMPVTERPSRVVKAPVSSRYEWSVAPFVREAEPGNAKGSVFPLPHSISEESAHPRAAASVTRWWHGRGRADQTRGCSNARRTLFCFVFFKVHYWRDCFAYYCKARAHTRRTTVNLRGKKAIIAISNKIQCWMLMCQ